MAKASHARAWNTGSDFKERSKMLRHISMTGVCPLPTPNQACRKLPSGWLPPTQALRELKASSPKTPEMPVEPANKQRPGCFLCDLQPSPSPASPPANLRWWKITVPSRLACWKAARLEGVRGTQTGKCTTEFPPITWTLKLVRPVLN